MGLATFFFGFFFYVAEALRGPWPPHASAFYITHNDAPQ